MTKHSLLSANNPDLSVVIPCLNEEDTMETCLSKLVTVAEKEKVYFGSYCCRQWQSRQLS